MNNEDMSEIFNKFSNMINEGNIPDEMKGILSSLSNNKSNTGESTNSKNGSTLENDSKNEKRDSSDSSSIDFETIMKMKSIMDKMKGNANDPRANLLLSLKPYLKESRKEKIDQYIKLFSMSKVMEIFKETGGETKK